MDGGGEAGEYRFSCGPWEASPEKSWVDRPTQGKPKVHPTEKLISGHGQKQVLRNVEERGRHPALPPSFLLDLPTSPVPQGVSGLSPAKSQQRSSRQDQKQVKFIHLMASEELQAV